MPFTKYSHGTLISTHKKVKSGSCGGNGTVFAYTSDFSETEGITPHYFESSGERTPGYRTRKIRSDLPMNAYRSSLVRANHLPYRFVEAGTGVLGDPPNQYTCSYTYTTSKDESGLGISPLAVGVDQGLIDASNRAIAKLGEQASATRFNAAQFFAERRQTAELFASTANRIASAVRSLKKANLKGFMQSLSLSGTEARSVAATWRQVERTPASKRIANHWLEYVFGWVPLLDDVKGAAELLAARAVSDVPKGSITGQGRALMTYASNNGTIAQNLLYRTKVRYVCHVDLEDEAKMLLSQTGISNPLLLAWELVPYSFVVDWFLPVGNYLESLTAFDGFVFKQGTRANTIEAESERWYLNPESNGIARCSNKGRLYERTVLGSFPTAQLNFVNPLGGNALKRFATSMALLRQLFGR